MNEFWLGAMAGTLLAFLYLLFKQWRRIWRGRK